MVAYCSAMPRAVPVGELACSAQRTWEADVAGGGTVVNLRRAPGNLDRLQIAAACFQRARFAVVRAGLDGEPIRDGMAADENEGRARTGACQVYRAQSALASQVWPQSSALPLSTGMFGRSPRGMFTPASGGIRAPTKNGTATKNMGYRVTEGTA